MRMHGISCLKGQKIISDHPECYINDKKVVYLLEQYDDVFLYYGQVKIVNDHLENHDYHQAIAGLNILSEMYNSNNIHRFGMETTDVYGFIKRQKNSDLTFEAADYFTEVRKYEIAFLYLELLKNQNISTKETRLLQQKIGEGLGVLDNQSNSTKEKKLSEYTKNSKWFRYFKKSYLR